MTDQPTKWTPERARADLIAHAIDVIHHTAVRNPRDGGARMRRAKDVLIGIVSEVVAERDTAVAEIATQKARADAAEQRAVDASAEVHACLQLLVPDVKGSVGVLSLAAERRMADLEAEIKRLRAELAAKQPAEAEAAQQGPSDEEVEALIDKVEDGHTWKALRWVARRAGVKL